MESTTTIRVSDIVRMQEEARKSNRIPYRSKARNPEAFEQIFKKECEELSNGRETVLQD